MDLKELKKPVEVGLEGGRRSGKSTKMQARTKTEHIKHSTAVQDVIDIAKEIETKFNVIVKLWGVAIGNIYNLQIKLPNGKVKGYEFKNSDEAYDFLSDFVEKMEAKA